MLKIYNTLNKQIEEFKPVYTRATPGKLLQKKIGLYTCGPTVYNYAHIGNLRTYVFEDILKRALKYNGYKINHVMNITDVGHLTSDADEGEDKLEKGAKRENKTVWEIAEFYTKKFQENLLDLNILEPDVWCKATDHIKEQIKLVQTLINKGYTYETNDGIYFDTTKVADYGKLANLQNQELKAGARIEMGEKKNPHDFALWKWSERHSERHPERPEGVEGSPTKKRQMEWHAPFGTAQGKSGRMGFPGWHIECSAMSIKYLGEQFDLHCGGIDHVSIHHTNEIAQSEAVTDKKPWVKYWLHGEFLNMGSDKMSKAGDNFVTLDTLKEKGISPLAYRYLLLQTHYRKQLTFSWEALEAAQAGLDHLYEEVLKVHKVPKSIKSEAISEKFQEAINNDLDTPKALAIVWEAIKNKEIDYKTLLKFDKILGLNFSNVTIQQSSNEIIPDEINKLLDLRQQARAEKNWAESDRLREEITKLGYEVEDTNEGQKITKI
ncbi:MAG: Cysteine-tRNA ligase [Candidatus Magasanikbacteria bacterium GW2011_GWC2_37_14]|uniref:Cysteine--tRNA ligase n=1 Tax=Candidatus Magasanikbacteria bacterium GW2011_GWC2_37_14 TaxID=1619046 RepID=A0A0G0ITE2_9BACT|nr:MAG: Cysteine-tRNA ligase [Candidatus Magasanikbacteria bacterium GW2011_GWC2_37_14]